MANGTRWMERARIALCCPESHPAAADRLVPPWVGSCRVKESIYDKASEVIANARITPVSRKAGNGTFIRRETTIAIGRSHLQINIYR